MKKRAYLGPLFVLTVLVITSLACGSSSNAVKVGETTISPTNEPPKVEIFKAGDVIQDGDHTIVLNSAEFQGNLLKANFTIENKGTSDLAVSSLLSFSARDSEGTTLEQNIFDCGSALDGTVLPGDKLKGDICWDGAATDTIKIYYESDLFSSGAVVWEVAK